MEILLVSDNHGLHEPIDYVLDEYKNIEHKIHCGDFEMPVEYLKDFKVVNGNNDYTTLPNSFKMEIGSFKILIMHGHPYASIFNLTNLAKYAKKQGCNTVFFGHTHVFTDECVLGIRMINPGSLWHNRDGSKPSYAIVKITDFEIIVEKKELYK